MRRFLFILCAILSNFVIAIAAQVDNGYYYRSWITDVTVKPNNTWDINESYEVTFVEDRHGIYRYLQNEFGANRNLSNDSEPLDVQYLVYRPEINVIEATGAEIDINCSDENDCTVIRWGSADIFVNGNKSYGLRYTYQTPDDRIQARDYIFHSLLPKGVPTGIKSFKFHITFEKPLPADIDQRLQIFNGPFGSNRLAKVKNLKVTPTSISGEIRDVKPFDAVTIYAELPEGYYEDTLTKNPRPAWIFFYISVAIALLLLFYELTERGPSYTQSVEFYPPEGITPTLVGKIIDGSTDDIDIAALIPWFAQQGYIQIREIQKESGLFGKKADVELTKLKDLPESAPDYQHKIMALLFDGEDVVKMNEMGDRHTKAQAAKNAVNQIFKGKQELTNSHHGGLFLLLILTSTISVLLSSPVRMVYSDAIIAAMIWGATFLFAWIDSFSMGEKRLFLSKSKMLTSTLIRLFAFAFIMFMIYLCLIDSSGIIYPIGMAIGFAILCFIVCEIAYFLVHDTPYRAEMAGKLKGFREFIDTAEKDRLKKLVDENPSYFYDVLPYAMIFGLTDKWTDLFRDIELKPAPWYISSSPMNSNLLCTNISEISSSISKAIATTAVDHTSSSSSGSSGGGFSGGGGGGGGAGSW